MCILEGRNRGSEEILFDEGRRSIIERADSGRDIISRRGR